MAVKKPTPRKTGKKKKSPRRDVMAHLKASIKRNRVLYEKLAK